jgi:branched-chain amino acid transport system substrate-binding protein
MKLTRRFIKLTRRFITLVLAAGVAAFAGPAMAQQTIKIGELSSYKAFPAFTDPYKKGWQMAVDEINATGGIDGKKLEVISRDDGANPGDAVRVAEELVSSEALTVLAGTFLSNVGLAVANFASQKKVFFLGSEPLTDKMKWSAGNKYTFRLRPSTYMQMAMAMPDVIAAHKKRWALVYPSFEYGQAASETFKEFIKKAQPDVEIATEQATPPGKIDAGAVAQAIDDAKPDAILSLQFGTDLLKFVREGNTRGIFKNRFVVNLLAGEPEYLDPMKEEAPTGWVVTGYPWNKINTPKHKAFLDAYQKKYNDYPRLGSVVGYLTIRSIAAGLAKAGSTEPDALVMAFKGLAVDGPFGRFEYRASDHQATMGCYVGKLAVENGEGTMVDFKYVDGASVLPGPSEVAKLRPASAN